MDKAKNNAQEAENTQGRVAPGAGKSAQVDAKVTGEKDRRRSIIAANEKLVHSSIQLNVLDRDNLFVGDRSPVWSESSIHELHSTRNENCG